MKNWSHADLEAINGSETFFVSPLREDGSTYGTPTRVWAVVVNGTVYARAASGPQSSWYRAAIAQGAGRVQVDGNDRDVTFSAGGQNEAEAIDLAYARSYDDASSVRHMQSSGPTGATVVITAA